MKQTRIIVAGGRDFEDKELAEAILVDICQGIEPEHITIVSGGAKGADAIGESLARRNHLNLCIYPANWDKHGKSAGHRRNALMADNADQLLAFWDGESPGTKSMIDKAKAAGLVVTLICYKPDD